MSAKSNVAIFHSFGSPNIGVRALSASILLHGPPGGGKVNKQRKATVLTILYSAHTHVAFAAIILYLVHFQTQLAQAIAGESQASFMAISPSDILSKFVGESEASMRDVFDKGKYSPRT